MAKLTPLQTQALATIKLILDREKKYHEANKLLSQLQGDFSNYVAFMDMACYDEIIKLLDEILGDELASYFMLECKNMKNGGSIGLKNGKKYRLKTIKDLETYLKERDEK